MTPLYKILSLGLSYPEAGNWDTIEKHYELSRDRYAGELQAGLDRFMAEFCERRHRLEEMQCEYLRLFDVGREISPYETEHITEKISRKPFELADIGGFYRAFGLDISRNRRYKEAPDHISVELEFMAILSWKETYAIMKGQNDHAAIVQEASLKFIKDHLAVWGFFFCRRISATPCDAFFKNLAMLLECILTLECRRVSLDTALFDKPMDRDPYQGVRAEELTCRP